MVFIKDIKVRVRRLIDLVDRSHNDLTGRDAPHAHPLSAIDGTFNNSNLLANITPTISNWTTPPGTLANLTDEIDNTLTTHGIVAVNSIIKYDLGASKRVLISISTNQNLFYTTSSIDVSNDDSTYYILIAMVALGRTNSTFLTSVSAVAKTRYIQFNSHGSDSGIIIDNLGLRVYLI